MRFRMHSRRQVSCLKETKKVVLFLVEGVTDETAFGLLLSRIIEEQQIVKFKIIGGDITSRSGTTAKNCVNRVVDQVKEFLAQDIYQKSDLLEVIHLIDLDGAFVSPDHIVCDPDKLPHGTHIYYTSDSILTDHVEQICERNRQKTEVLNKLITLHELYGKIPYQIYFFSCNLEHVFYDCQNAPDPSKYQMAKQLVDRYIKDPMEFIQFMNSEEIKICQEYEESWEYMKKEEESLKRHSNFHLYLNQYRKQELM